MVCVIAVATKGRSRSRDLSALSVRFRGMSYIIDFAPKDINHNYNFPSPRHVFRRAFLFFFSHIVLLTPPTPPHQDIPIPMPIPPLTQHPISPPPQHPIPSPSAPTRQPIQPRHHQRLAAVIILHLLLTHTHSIKRHIIDCVLHA